MDKLQKREYSDQLWLARRDAEELKESLDYYLSYHWTYKEQVAAIIEAISNELSMLKERYERLRILEAGLDR